MDNHTPPPLLKETHCPRQHCFFWLEEGDLYASGLCKNLEMAIGQLEKATEGRCECSPGRCIRDERLPLSEKDPEVYKDFYEPINPLKPEHFQPKQVASQTPKLMQQPTNNPTIAKLPTPAGSVVDYLETNAPGCLREVLARPRRLPTLESWSTYGENCPMCYYHIPKAQESDPMRALALLLINTRLYAIDLPFSYVHGLYDFDLLDIAGIQSYYKSHAMREKSAEQMRNGFRGFLDQNLAEPQKSFALDGKPLEEAHFLAANPLVQEEIQGAWAIIEEWNRGEYFVETERSWAYWFWWMSV